MKASHTRNEPAHGICNYYIIYGNYLWFLLVGWLKLEVYKLQETRHKMVISTVKYFELLSLDSETCSAKEKCYKRTVENSV